jgi:hypothetical protein
MRLPYEVILEVFGFLGAKDLVHSSTAHTHLPLVFAATPPAAATVMA